MKTIITIAAIGVSIVLGAYYVLGKSPEGRDQNEIVSVQSDNGQSDEKAKRMIGKPVPFDLDVPDGFEITLYAEAIDGIRDIVVSPGGTILVSSPGNGTVYALPDTDGNGFCETPVAVLTRLTKPHGIAFHNNTLYLAEETKVSAYRWDETRLSASEPEKLFDLPPGGRHSTRSLAIDPDGTVYVSVGSTCDTCIEDNTFHGTVLAYRSGMEGPEVYARGLRNAVFITIHPRTHLLWSTEMSRDFLGDDIPPDEINIVREGNDYGWPLCWGDRVYDEVFGEGSPADCTETIPPVHAIQAHSAPLGLEFIDSDEFFEAWDGDLIVAYHGSWNRSVPVGYKVVRLDIEGNQIVGETDLITGFLRNLQTLGRPVDVLLHNDILYITDDKNGTVYQMYR